MSGFEWIVPILPLKPHCSLPMHGPTPDIAFNTDSRKAPPRLLSASLLI